MARFLATDIGRDFILFGSQGWIRLEKVRLFNTLRLRQNSHHIPDNILKHIFLNEDVSILIKIS